MTPDQREERRERDIYRVTIIGSVGNLMLTLLKFFAGIVGHSAAMLADAVHSLSDLITDFVVIAFVRIAGKPQDTGHEFGHGKYETLATALIGLMLLFVGLGICWNGARSIWLHVGGHPIEAPGMVAFWMAIASIVVKELLYQYTVRHGRRLQSDAVVANAWHHRSDAFSSIGTALGIGGAAMLGHGWQILDPLAAIVVSVFIVKVSVSLLMSCMGQLTDHALPAHDEEFIKTVVCNQPGASDPHRLRTRHVGRLHVIDLHFRMDGQTTITDAHHTATAIENKLREHFGHDTIITTHVEPVK
ncbi:MAG: cation diffusion facilitator family transporter [Alloprevotella sp.]